MVKAKNSSFFIAGEEVRAGQKRVINLPLPSLYTMQSALSLAVHVVNGRQPGPKLFVCAALHGDEINGVEIVRRLFKRKAIDDIRGTLIAIPIVNVFGIVQHSRYLPDGRDLNRSFPGTEKGSLASRLAYVFTEQIVKQCTHGIDLHAAGGHRINLPQIRANLDDPATLALARSFGVPVVINSRLRDGSLREAAGELGLPMLVYEAGESLRFNPFAIRAGVQGLISVMRYLEMLPEVRQKQKTSEPFVSHTSNWVRAPTSGILHNHRALGDKVASGELLGLISDPSDCIEDTKEEIRTPVDGIVIGHTRLPLVNEGDALFHIASFDDAGEVAAGLESFQYQEPGLIE